MAVAEPIELLRKFSASRGTFTVSSVVRYKLVLGKVT